MNESLFTEVDHNILSPKSKTFNLARFEFIEHPTYNNVDYFSMHYESIIHLFKLKSQVLMMIAFIITLAEITL